MIALLIVLIALLYTLFSFVIQRKMANMKKVYEIQEIIKQKSKELSDMVKNGAKNEELMLKQREVMSLASESMINQMKPMIIILPLFLVVYYWLLPLIFPTHPQVIIDGIKFAYNTFFIIVVFIFGLILSFSVMLIDRNRRKKEQQTKLNQAEMQSKT
ncbi:MAG: EMC3/TMCO1 family protein [Candidatus Micrarchaeota archaeon]